MSQKPSIARNVHYQSFGTPNGEYKAEPRAAIVTQVHEDGETVGLAILNPAGMFFNAAVKHAPGDVPTPGMWNWPPRIEHEHLHPHEKPPPTPLPGPGRPRSDSA